MEALLCTTNIIAASLATAGLPLLRRRTSPYTGALSAPLFLRRCSLPARGLRCAGEDWSEPSFVGVAEKPSAAAAVARKARAFTGAGGEEEKGRLGAINGVSGAVEEPVAVPFAPFEQSFVAVESVGDEALSQALASKLDFEETSTYTIYGTGAFFAGWILSAVVSAIDSIPLLPKIL